MGVYGCIRLRVLVRDGGPTFGEQQRWGRFSCMRIDVGVVVVVVLVVLALVPMVVVVVLLVLLVPLLLLGPLVVFEE